MYWYICGNPCCYRCGRIIYCICKLLSQMWYAIAYVVEILHTWCIITVAQTRHFIKHLLHDFTKTFAPRFYNFLHDFTISSTILQFPPRLYNFLHDFTIFSTILQFSPRYYNFLHDITISSTILQFPPRFYNFLHDFTISSTIVPKHLLHDFTNICSTILQFPPRFYNFLHDFTIFSTILQFSPRFYNFLHDITKSWRKL